MTVGGRKSCWYVLASRPSGARVPGCQREGGLGSGKGVRHVALGHGWCHMYMPLFFSIIYSKDLLILFGKPAAVVMASTSWQTWQLSPLPMSHQRDTTRHERPRRIHYDNASHGRRHSEEESPSCHCAPALQRPRDQLRQACLLGRTRDKVFSA